MKQITLVSNDITYTIIIGENAKENWELIENSEPDDLWFHVEESSSAHVVVSQDVKSKSDVNYPDEIIEVAANLSKQHSKQKNSKKKVQIVYTKILNLKKGKAVGSVFVFEPKYICI